jgi:hypothetical protein
MRLWKRIKVENEQSVIKKMEAKTEIAFVAKELRVPYECSVDTESSTFDSVVRYQILCYGLTVVQFNYFHHHIIIFPRVMTDGPL